MWTQLLQRKKYTGHADIYELQEFQFESRGGERGREGLG
jgi:hypothetical protein